RACVGVRVGAGEGSKQSNRWFEGAQSRRARAARAESAPAAALTRTHDATFASRGPDRDTDRGAGIAGARPRPTRPLAAGEAARAAHDRAGRGAVEPLRRGGARGPARGRALVLEPRRAHGVRVARVAGGELAERARDLPAARGADRGEPGGIDVRRARRALRG